ncbi:MFS transporter [Luteipulveratus sp. YIM 133132]|uniref:MFS transporter n=1 Tax=Luteipulveratus flavus TaxID=3031728 RepID=A0ABT6C580_9MICO|nr:MULTISPECIES: MFS transporter [unclassified Luteipulveratus]MDE9364423.1 MFS transporter [Luteipulveratus sp. YIM 133132]MDF8263970.1 MFS transporter [Luteipulveratus sp. YIM 133296]
MRERLGIPPINGHRTFVTAVAVDAIGSGVFLPVAVLYFVATTSLSLSEVGLAMSVAALVGLPVVLAIGQVVDRVGPRRVLLVANIASALGFVGFTVAESFPVVTALLCLVGIGQSAFWASYSPLVAAISREGERELWFGFLGALRNVGFAVGGLSSGLAISIGTDAAYRALVLANAVSYAVAFVLYLRVEGGGPAERSDEQATASWSVALRDRPFSLVVLANFVYAMCCVALNVAMPVYASQVLHLSGWVTGAIFTVNTALIGFGQGLVVRSMTGRVRYRLVIAGYLVFAAGFLLLGGVSALSATVASVAILGAVAVYTLGELVAGPVLITIAVESRPEEVRGRYLALQQLTWLVTGVVAPTTYTWLLSHGKATVWLALAGLALLGCLVAALMPRALPVAAAPVTNEATSGEEVAADARTAV